MEATKEACEKIQSIKYQLNEVGVGQNEAFVPVADVKITQEKMEGENIGLLMSKILVQGTSDSKKKGKHEFGFAYNGDDFTFFQTHQPEYILIDEPTSKIVGRKLGFEYGMMQIFQFGQKEPFKGMIDKASSIDLLGEEEIFGEVCYRISLEREVPKAPGSSEMRKAITEWYISKNDYLPRGLKTNWSFKTLKIIETNKQYSSDYFKVSAPEGINQQEITGNEASSDGMLTKGKVAPDWELLAPDGKTHRLSDYSGKVILIDFWGTWCMPCIKAMPKIQSIHEKFLDDGLQVIGISVNDKEGKPEALMEKKGFTYQLLLKGEEVAKNYQVSFYPSVYIIGKDGTVSHAEYGSSREGFKEELISIIEKEGMISERCLLYF